MFKGRFYAVILYSLLLCNTCLAQYADGDRWYNNPLGFEPVKLHTSMGFILPAIAVGAGLLFTAADKGGTHKMSVYIDNGYSWGYKYPYTFLPQINMGFDYQLRKWMSAGVELELLYARDAWNNTGGVAIRPFARFYPVNNEKWQLYFESGGGFVYLVDQFPQPTTRDDRLGTQLNGITRYGIGAAFHVNEQVSVTGSVRHLHISNGDKKGAERNPSHDSNGFAVGASYRL
ncbi:acyloxyacyl hydrolase [Chitinophaga japonensis]|uniref:Lipid A 3-O-deacylase PagL n=1 Tax=Chitinophaga japonensis TaxID=104662 RepID=A0A562TDD5_CHIJA|nr:acyloxyacyl hydrolase [Chitinophaga japonensis]TWI91288.1 lipid A 3-O-deacylase PagL [Chitinophaga japonensis]